jgi:methionine synthase I (cobalamin-dependent)
MVSFLDALHSGRVLLMGGAMGTELQRAGLRPDENATAWTLLHPDRVRAVHQAYRTAGAEVLLTNTFLINASTLVDTFRAADRLPVKMLQLWQTAYDLLEGAVYRLASLGPVAGRIAEREFDQWAWFYNHSSSFHYERADAVLLETCSSPRVRYALKCTRQVCECPLLLSLAYTRNAAGALTTFSGHSPEWFARRARAYGVAALGVNCGRDIGMEEVIEIIHRYRQETDLPLFARPNAGTPTRVGERWVYPHTPESMAARLPELLEAGVAMVGGCCGTTPAHIAAFRAVVDDWNARQCRGQVAFSGGSQNRGSTNRR